MNACQCSVLPSDQNKCVCVCVYQEQSVLGLEVEVISLIGTLPCSLPTSPSVISLSLSLSLSPPMMLFSAVHSLSPSLVICPDRSPFHSFSPRLRHSLVICPFSFHTCFLQQGPSVISSKRTGGIETSIAGRDRGRRDKIREGEREKEMRKTVALTQSHTDHSLLTTHTHMHTLLWLIGQHLHLESDNLTAKPLLLTQMPDTIVFLSLS